MTTVEESVEDALADNSDDEKYLFKAEEHGLKGQSAVYGPCFQHDKIGHLERSVHYCFEFLSDKGGWSSCSLNLDTVDDD